MDYSYLDFGLGESSDGGEWVKWIYRATEILMDIEDGAIFYEEGDEELHCENLKGLLDNFPQRLLNFDFENKKSNPYMKILADCINDEIHYFGLEGVQHVSPSRLLGSIENELDSMHFDKEKDNVRRNRDAVSKSLLQYFLGLKAAYSKLMVIRLDLHTKDDASIVQHWEQLLKYIAARYASSFVGYAAKFEYGIERGVHMHTVLLFNGAVVRQDVTIAKAIGEYWKLQITHGWGSYFNANQRDHVAHMKYRAVGTFCALDDDFVEGLTHMANYLAKPDLVVKFALPNIGRVFRRGQLKADQTHRIARRAARAGRAQLSASDDTRGRSLAPVKSRFPLF